LYYVYGILCSNAYLDAFEGVLFTVAGSNNWPRIPIVANRNLFDEISAQGEILAALEDFDREAPLTPQISALANKFEAEFRMTDFDVNDDSESIKLFSENGVRIELSPIPREILTFQISGYNVLNQWLKFNSNRYTRATFGQDLYGKLLSLLSRIELQLATIGELDALIEPLITGETTLL